MLFFVRKREINSSVYSSYNLFISNEGYTGLLQLLHAPWNFLQSISSRGHTYHKAHDFPGLVTEFTKQVNFFNLALKTEHFWSTIKLICVFSQSLGNDNPQCCVTCTCSNMCM